MSEPIIANTVRINHCPPDCPCQSVHIEFLDADNQVFASIPLASADARIMSKDLQHVADIADAARARIEGRVQ